MEDYQAYDENFAPKAIADLLDGKHHFVIPSYQRGYRWENKQVLDLLEDIKQFADNDVNSNSYFLQPVVVRPLDDNKYEVLDGQQRLTTMLLVLKRLMRKLSPDDSDYFKNRLYSIEYTNRPQLDFDNPNAADNIDSYYLAEAQRIINEWFNQQRGTNLDSFKASLLYTGNQKKQVKIIWYAIDRDSQDLVSIKIFNRLNKGKISLTSSELIKALFIMDYDLRSSTLNAGSSDQLSMEWNEMERRFQDDEFWYFISNDNNDMQTRIDLLFDYVTCRQENADSDYSYREFQKLYDFCRKQSNSCTNNVFDSPWAQTNNVYNMQDAWRVVRRTYDRLVAWYEDNLYYHYVGYLVTIGFTPLQINNYLEGMKRERKKQDEKYEWSVEDTTLAFQRKIMERFKDKNKYISKDCIDDFEYDDYSLVKKTLLLFNVEYCRISQNLRFAFAKFKKENWDIEHIDSRNESSLQELTDRKRWLKNAAFVLEELDTTDEAKKLADECKALLEKSKDSMEQQKYKEIYKKVVTYYSSNMGDTQDDEGDVTNKKDYISNLTLLDSATNREYKDAPFAYKRYCIVKYDCEGNRYIPPCTRNVFLKYYTDSNKDSSHLDIMKWNNADRQGYIKAIHKILDPIFDSVCEK